MEAELEVLRRDREEKLKAIAEKKKQVEELRRQRSERQEKRTAGERKGSANISNQVDNLVAEILGSDAGVGDKAEGALKELAAEASGSAKGGNRSVTLSTEVGISSVTVLPSEPEGYARGVQTDAVDFTSAGGGDGGRPGLVKKGTNNLLDKVANKAATNRGRAGPQAQQPKTRVRQTYVAEGGVGNSSAGEGAEKKEIVELTQEEKDKTMASPDFHAFFDRTSLIVERILGQADWDYAADFKQHQGRDREEDKDAMQHAEDFHEERWTSGRTVTDCRFSPHNHEIFLAGYGQKENPSLSDPDGCMLVWNVAMKQRPEMVFSSQSAVLCARFNKFNPALFFGGTYSGGVVLWDARAKAGPVQRTLLSGKGHAHPVQAMQQVGTQNATNLITASNDGRLCVWSLAMLALPQDSVDLKNETKNRRDVAVMTLAFPENETNTLYVGAEDGAVCQCQIHGSKNGVTEVYDGHEGPVTGIDFHPRLTGAAQGVESYGDLALTTSFDWSIKLWSVKHSQWPVLSLDSFEDYVYDVRWHPSHPAVFCSVDGEGHVDLWNLNQSMESPIERCEHPQGKKLALNKCDWAIDGKKLVTGDSEGTCSVYTVDKKVANCRNEDYGTFQEKIKQLQPIVPRTKGDASGLSTLGGGRAGGSDWHR
jgi:dynein intermediate chain